MSKPPDPHYRHRFPAELISHAVWLYHVFSLSFRDVELLLAERGVIVSYESVRQWCLKFGAGFADKMRRRRPRPGDKWYMDEVFIRIKGELHFCGAPLTRTGSCSISWCRPPRCGCSEAFLQAPAEGLAVYAARSHHRQAGQLRRGKA